MAVLDLCEMTPTDLDSLQTLDSPKRIERDAKDGNRHSRVTPFGGRALRVLVVGTDQDQNDELAELALHGGQTVKVAQTGHAALRKAALQHPDVVLLQLELPQMSGLQVARHLRRDFPSRGCLIVALAEQIDDALRRKCRTAGVDLLLNTPLDAEVVETLLMLECSLVNRS